MKIIGITGGVGAGKSTIVELMKQQYTVQFLHCDEIAHTLMKKGGAAYEQIVSRFGSAILGEDGEIDRAKLSQAAFLKPDGIEALNRIVHPLVREAVEKSIACLKAAGFDGIILIEAALLLEAGYRSLCDEVWYVYATEETRRARLYAARGYSKERVDKLFAAQYTEEQFLAESDFVLYNDETVSACKKSVSDQIKEQLAKGE